MLLFKLILSSLVFASTHAFLGIKIPQVFEELIELPPASTVCSIAVSALGGTPARHSSLALYKIFKTYYQGLYSCSVDYPAADEACAIDIYNRTQDSTECYDEDYKNCMEGYYLDFVASLDDPAMFAAAGICYNPDLISVCLEDVDCYTNSYDCKIGTDCFLDAGGLQCLQDCGYAQLAAVADDECPDYCNLLEVCQGGGFECVEQAEKCRKFFRDYDKNHSKCVARSYF